MRVERLEDIVREAEEQATTLQGLADETWEVVRRNIRQTVRNMPPPQLSTGTYYVQYETVQAPSLSAPQRDPS